MKLHVPFDPRRLVFPPVPAAVIAYAIYQICTLFVPESVIVLVIAGGLTGYVIYDMIHFYLHYGAPKEGSYFYHLKRYHNQHHFAHHDSGFGISSVFWDKIFGSAIKLRRLAMAIKCDVGSSKSLRHLTRYGCSAPACVLRIATAKATHDETEAFHRRRRETLRPGSHVMKGATSDCVGPSTYGSFGRLPFFIATWITDPASTPLISAKHVPRFSLGQMEGRSQNGLPFSLIKSRTQCDRFNIPNFLALPRKWTRPNNF
ncbi:hypothetical protein GEV33_000854 [Tenebrio molitor]|uniref:Fatty acid hydroxylase domain-containing protein n=1 Tax=Tenebrio molitor TaxID=7067 RepID=A0A8J6HXB8_TENMO|nr:hypothetical protein GEV33_000854 [Tenebrio molitor]